jgi:Transcriptional regulatory protein, C terminal
VATTSPYGRPVADVASRPIILRWPEDDALRESLRAARIPRLLLVERGRSLPSDLGPLEDWVTSDAGPDEIEARSLALASRADESTHAPVVDDDDLLRFDDRWAALGAIEARIARLLVERLGAVVRRADLRKAAWGEAATRSNTMDAAIHRFRAHAASVGLEVVTVRRRGYMLVDPAREQVPGP